MIYNRFGNSKDTTFAEIIAVDLIYHYVFRGDREKELQQSYYGSANSEYSAMIRGKYIEISYIGKEKVDLKVDYHKTFKSICSLPEVKEHHNYLKAVEICELTSPIIYLI